MNTRPETGPMTFDGDWWGVFIRGDNAFGYLQALRMISDPEASTVAREYAVAMLRGLTDLLASADHHAADPEEQRMRPFAECVLP